MGARTINNAPLSIRRQAQTHALLEEFCVDVSQACDLLANAGAG
ncbi:hypothetical protein BOSE21B_150040 [Bosea sp. 21B]|nr:hypothetical protein BOSE21B_150040 [Bosea sp. 21B]CAD5300696.1 hypothetical protein BOSE7B_90068 [Bosea sp. 7B]VXC60119.1 hypothetical protein BOSE127_230040 [Bosea sp. 127]VXC68594.1 hypothetical protein BOSE125_310006 [Bosea sp. 125]